MNPRTKNHRMGIYLAFGKPEFFVRVPMLNGRKQVRHMVPCGECGTQWDVRVSELPTGSMPGDRAAGTGTGIL